MWGAGVEPMTALTATPSYVGRGQCLMPPPGLGGGRESEPYGWPAHPNAPPGFPNSNLLPDQACAMGGACQSGSSSGPDNMQFFTMSV